MKTYLIIFILFISIKGLGQNSFPDSNAIWNVTVVNAGGTPTDEMLYGLKGDTLINDTLYNKLYTLSDTTLSDENLQVYIGGFRQEGQKVWFKPNYGNINDFLLYDFAAQIGDTIWHNVGLTTEYDNGQTILVFNSNNYYVSVVLDKHIDNGFERYDVETGSFDKSVGFLWSVRHFWIDGIGSTIGMFWQHNVPPLSNPYPKNLACFKHNDTVKYQNNLQCNRCFCKGGVYSKSKNVSLKNEKRLFPNPCSSYLIISNCALSEGNELLKVFDLNGRVVKQVYISSVPFNLDLSDLQAGHYLVKFPFEEGSREQLIVVND